MTSTSWRGLRYSSGSSNRFRHYCLFLDLLGGSQICIVSVNIWEIDVLLVHINDFLCFFVRVWSSIKITTCPGRTHHVVLTRLSINLFRALIHIHFEITFLHSRIRKNHFSISMLNPFCPFTLVDAAIGPLHLSISIPLVFFIFAFVNIPTSPCENAKAMLLIITIVSLVLVALRSHS